MKMFPHAQNDNPQRFMKIGNASYDCAPTICYNSWILNIIQAAQKVSTNGETHGNQGFMKFFNSLINMLLT
jgi:hypothetical protein